MAVCPDAIPHVVGTKCLLILEACKPIGAVTMRCLALLAFAVSLLTGVAAKSNGLTDLVEWDEFSLTVNGSRVYIQ